MARRRRRGLPQRFNARRNVRDWVTQGVKTTKFTVKKRFLLYPENRNTVVFLSGLTTQVLASQQRVVNHLKHVVRVQKWTR